MDTPMDYAQFKRQMTAFKQEIYLETLAENRASIRIKKEKTIVKNLEKIFTATLKISNQKGFQAMSMRDLCQETGISLGALYAYFAGKDDLLTMLQTQRRAFVRRMMEKEIQKHETPVDQLRAMIRTHLFLSETLQPWFYFSFMEAKNLEPKEKKEAIESDRYTENLLETILARGQDQGCFHQLDIGLTAEVIKAMLQNWYLKRSKFRSREVSVETYMTFVIQFIETNLGVTPDK